MYLQIKETIKDRILHGVYPLYTTIPSEPQLEEEFSVSKITIRNAIKELVTEGYLETASGRGTKVIANTPSPRLAKGKRFTEWLVDEGHKLEKRIISIAPCKVDPSSFLFGSLGSTCLQVKRLYLLDEAPYIYFIHYIKVDEQTLLNVPQTITSLYRFMDEAGIHLEAFKDEFSVAIPPEEVSAMLELSDQSPLLKRIRWSTDEKAQLVEYSEGYYMTDKQHYVVTYNDL
ncbi:GntR family transcriptional regulator [Aureibacillus halotolerans]|uniref:GntR family transcriptional regulator n=1 Tax=Aureibacillus halotolerans TaxID=1508390 RepID=A0A4R6U5J8_9BACI|nr:GntR family transcriptional regulator [Aureibacillus halotolerans]